MVADDGWRLAEWINAAKNGVLVLGSILGEMEKNGRDGLEALGRLG